MKDPKPPVSRRSLFGGLALSLAGLLTFVLSGCTTAHNTARRTSRRTSRRVSRRY